MKMESNDIARLDRLIEKGEKVLASHTPNPPNVIGFPILDRSLFSEWKSQSLSCIEALCGREHSYYKEYDAQVKKNAYLSSAKGGVGILKAIREEIAGGYLWAKEPRPNAVAVVQNICSRFHKVARQLRARHQNRETLNVRDEYDVQDLFHALLQVNFDDVRAEEATPSYAAKSSRIDFLLKSEQVIVEIKKSREGLTAKEVGSQLIEDIDRYKVHPNCKTLVCFVYDPDGLVANPKGLEADLSRSSNPFPVHVIIQPQ